MNEIIKSILSRVLSEELGRQQTWLEEDEEIGSEEFINDRKKVIATIEAFMDENGIQNNNLFKMSAYIKERK